MHASATGRCSLNVRYVRFAIKLRCRSWVCLFLGCHDWRAAAYISEILFPSWRLQRVIINDARNVRMMWVFVCVFVWVPQGLKSLGKTAYRGVAVLWSFNHLSRHYSQLFSWQLGGFMRRANNGNHQCPCNARAVDPNSVCGELSKYLVSKTDVEKGCVYCT